MLIQGTVIDPSMASTADGLTPNFNMGRANEMLVAELHGKYFEQCYRGNVFYASTATAGVVIPIANFTATFTPTYTIWNPAGSGKLCVPVVTLLGWTATTAALGALLWCATTSAGSGISSTGPFITFGSGSAVNANVGSAKVSAMRIGSGGSTTMTSLAATPAAFPWRNTGCTITPTAAASSTAPGWIWRDEWDGAGIVAPGTAIHLTGTTAIAMTMQITVAYVEVPL